MINIKSKLLLVSFTCKEQGILGRILNPLHQTLQLSGPGKILAILK